MSEKELLPVIFPQEEKAEKSRRLEEVLKTALTDAEGVRTCILTTAEETERFFLGDGSGTRGDGKYRPVLFVISLGRAGVNLEYMKLLRLLRENRTMLEGYAGGVITDGESDLYTKSVSRELVFTANLSGCAFVGRPLVELFLSRHKLDRYISSFEDRKNFLLFVMFFFPFFPDDLLCYAAGLVNIRWKYFLLAAVLGRPWGLLINCLVGISVFSLPSYGYIPAILFVIVTVAVSWRFGSAWEKMIIERVNRRKARYREKIESVRSRSGSAYENKN